MFSKDIMKYRTLGKNGPRVSSIGYGAMVLSPGIYGAVNDEQSLETLDYAIEHGINFFDTAHMYGFGTGHNEKLLGQAFSKRRDQVVIATKGGLVIGADGRPGLDGSPENLRKQLELSLQRLETDYVDVFYLHVPDPKVPVSESIGAMAGFVQEGKVRYLGISNFNLEQIRMAHATHQIHASQDQYSLFFRGPEDEGRTQLLQDLGIAMVAYSPLGQGVLGGASIQTSPDDYRTTTARFQGDQLEHAQRLGEQFRAIAQDAGINPAALAIAWLLHQGEHIVPIPGTRRAQNLKTNIEAVNLELSTDLLGQLNQTFPASVSMVPAF
jgi:aryl-alcohol dehydrogenase-like predicted oxidoreductase